MFKISSIFCTPVDNNLENLVSYHAQKKLPALCAQVESAVHYGKLNYTDLIVLIDTLEEIKQCMIDSRVKRYSINSNYVFSLENDRLYLRSN